MNIKDYEQGKATNEQFKADGAACELEVEKSAWGGRQGTKIFDACMRSKGYTKIPWEVRRHR